MNKIRTILVACCLLPVFCSCGEVAKRMDAKLAESKAAIGIVENTETDGVGESSLASGGKKSAATAVADGEYKDLEIPARLKSVPEQILRRTGYTVSYNSNRRVPNWVAWCLTPKRLTGNSKRSDAKFHEDTDVPEPRAIDFDYVRSVYDRGHMCPAGDNKWSEKAMEDCFRITNMCPQDGGLNRGMWNSIEQQCRAWAKKYGKVYVVCGPIYLNQQHRKIGKNKVVVPEAFFKVVLCMEGTPKAIGFICRNQSQKGKKKTDFINTIDDVERITGYDFFSKLPDDIEDKVEAHADINEW